MLPAIKALLAVSVARRRAGLPRDERLTLEVAPEPDAALPGRWDIRQEL